MLWVWAVHEDCSAMAANNFLYIEYSFEGPALYRCSGWL